jgi:glycosyltransferase involved in cell wall biosynthesis
MMAVSVIIPVYNGARFLGAAIESVLAQEHPVDEIIVVDDGSSDQSSSTAQDFGRRVRVISQANAGPAAARNNGIAHASSNVVAFLDADDIMVPQRIKRQAATMTASDDVEIVLSAQWLFRDGEPPRPFDDPNAAKQCLRQGFVPSTAFVKRAAFEKYGMFLSHQRVGDFIEWFTRAQSLECRYVMLSEPLVLRRIHEMNLSRTNRADYAQLVRTLRGRREVEPK